MSVASSVGSKRSLEDDDDEAQQSRSKAPRLDRLASETRSGTSQDRQLMPSSSALSVLSHTPPKPRPAVHASGSLDGANDTKEVPTSSTLTNFSQTPSYMAPSQRTAVRSSQDSDEVEILYTPKGSGQASNIVISDDDDGDSSSDHDSESSLEMLDFSSKARPQGATPMGAARVTPVEPKTDRTTRLQLGTVRRLNYYKPFVIEEVEPEAKFSLAKMIKDKQKEAAAQVEIARHREALEAAGQGGDSSDGETRTTREDMLQALVDSDDSDSKIRRLELAMGRTEAMKVEAKWRFFEGVAPADADESDREFPDWQVAEHARLCHLCDPNLREHSILTGFAAECISRSKCPPELRQWLWESAFEEASEVLARAYLDAFAACKEDVGGFVGISLIRTTLTKMGASERACSMSDPVRATTKSSKSITAATEVSAWRLGLLLSTLGDLAGRLDVTTRVYALSMLLRMGMDHSLAENGALRAAMHSSIAALVESFDDGDSETRLLEVGKAMFESVSSIKLRWYMVAAMPETSMQLHTFKRRLALAFGLEDTAVLEARLHEASDLATRIALRLQAVDVLDAGADYAGIAALASLLDIGIGGGFVIARKSSEDEAVPRKVHEGMFNDNVDMISRQVKALFSRIIDTGASHMGRTEAKGVLERLQYRLDYAVRTKPMAKKNVLVETSRRSKLGGASTESVTMMAAFLQKKQQQQNQSQPFENAKAAVVELSTT